MNLTAFFPLGRIGPLHDPVTWYGINYGRTQITQWDFQNKGTLTSPTRLSFVLEVPLRYLRPSIIYSVPCDRIVQRAYCPRKITTTMTSGVVHLMCTKGHVTRGNFSCNLQRNDDE